MFFTKIRRKNRIQRVATTCLIEQIEPRTLFSGLDGSELTDLPSSMKVSLYSFIGDHSVSNSEKWNMTVGGHTFSAINYGDVQRDLTQYKTGETYPITVIHNGSNRYVNGVNKPDYDYRAWIDKSANPAWTSAPWTISGTNYFVAENNDPALMQKRWFGSDQNNAAGKTANLVIPGIDLDVDTGNDDGFGTVYDNAPEDVYEESNSYGKYVVADTGDMDSDGIRDSADFNGVAGVSFVPIFLRLPAGLQQSGASLQNITISFVYDQADLTANETGTLRLWTVDASSARGNAELLETTEQVTAADLGMTFGGTTKLYVECVKGATANRRITVSANVAGTVWSGAVTDAVYVTPIKFNIKSVEFSALDPDTIFPVTKDDGTVKYDNLHWLDSNLDYDADDVGDRQYPVAYLRNASIVTTRQFVCTAPPSFVHSTKLVVHGVGTGGFDFWSQQNDPDPKTQMFYLGSSSNIFTSRDTASIPIPNWVEHIDPMTIKWSFSTDGGTNFNSVGDTKNQVYALLDAPNTSDGKLYHSVAHIATAGPVKGLADPGLVTDAIWQEFGDNSVTRVFSTTSMKYMHDSGSGYDTAALLSAGKGRCGAWANFFADTIKAHGIAAEVTAITAKTPAPTPPSGYSLIGTGIRTNLVPAQGSSGANYSTIEFQNHAVVKVGVRPTTVFDPSYGKIYTSTTILAAELAWEDSSLAGALYDYSDGSSTMTIVVGNTVGTLETVFTP